MFGDTTQLFLQYVKNRDKVILPARLLITDCFFLLNAFRAQSGIESSIALERVSVNGLHRERVVISDAYDLYDIDRDADGLEILVVHEVSGACCYWDRHERFVALTGPDLFLRVARPYPADIERHRYVEAMLHLEDSREPEKPEDIYDSLTAA